MFSARCWSSVVPAGNTLSQRATNGDRIASSYGTFLIIESRCSPYMIPLSVVYTISVLDSRPVASSSSTMRPTCRSTSCSASYCRCRNASSLLIAGPLSWIRCMPAGLSVMSSSLKLGGRYFGSHENVPMSCAAGVESACGACGAQYRKSG